MLTDQQVLICLLRPAAADVADDVRAHYAQADPRVTVIIDRRTRQRRRSEDPPPGAPERRGGADRRRFAVPRRLAPLPAALAERTGPVRWIQRMLPVGTPADDLTQDALVAAVRRGSPDAATELYWRSYLRMHSRLSVLLGNPTEAQATIGEAFGGVLDALDDPERAGEPFETLLYEQVDLAAEAVTGAGAEEDDPTAVGLGIEDPDLDEAVRILDPDAQWATLAGAECERLVELVGDEVAVFEHFGSTAVPGLPARGTLDILGGTDGVPLSAAAMSALEDAGYEDCGTAGTPGRRYLRCRGRVRVDLHLVEIDGPLWEDGLAFRDFLRRRSVGAQHWASVKRAAARVAPASAARYADLRRLALNDLLQRARREAGRRAAA